MIKLEEICDFWFDKKMVKEKCSLKKYFVTAISKRMNQIMNQT